MHLEAGSVQHWHSIRFASAPKIPCALKMFTVNTTGTLQRQTTDYICGTHTRACLHCQSAFSYFCAGAGQQNGGLLAVRLPACLE
jgi:hypothetical protein